MLSSSGSSEKQKFRIKLARILLRKTTTCVKDHEEGDEKDGSAISL